MTAKREDINIYLKHKHFYRKSTADNAESCNFTLDFKLYPMKTLLFPIILCLLVPFVSLSQWSTDPAVNNPINIMSGEQAIPKIATCPNGNSYIASFSSENGNYNVRMQLVDAQGNNLWTTNGILISDNPQMTWLTDWDMTADNANHAILTWQDITERWQ